MRRALRRLPPALVAACMLLACGGARAGAQPAGPACGGATISTIASVVGAVADNIYGGELGDDEVRADVRRVTSSRPLLEAVADANAAAARRAVIALVYHPFWHIVRVRVLDANGRLLTDIGGPDVIAPIRGVLELDGRVVGRYVMSVQDDLGFTLLELHAVDDPIAVYYHGRVAASQGVTFPRRAPGGPTLTVDGVSYGVVERTYHAFPVGTLEAVILVPPPAPSLAREPCTQVRTDEIGRVAELLSRRFHPLEGSYPDFVEVVHVDTGATVLLRIGPRAIPGSMGVGPAVLPERGEVSYLGRSWQVFSFAPTPPARIYILIPLPATPPSD